MTKSWADMSKDERSNYEGKKAYNKQHGLERYAEGGELEHKSDTYVPPSSANTNANNQSSSSSSSANTNASTQDNSSSGSSSAATQEQTNNRSEAHERTQTYAATQTNTQKTQEQQRQETFNQAQEYLNNHPNAGRGSVRDEGYHQILKEGGMNNNDFNNMMNDLRNSNIKQAKADKKTEAAAYAQYNRDKKEAGVVGTRGSYAVNLRDEMANQYSQTGRYSNDDYKNDVIKGLMDTGMKFGYTDIEREMGTNSTHDLKGLYGNKDGMAGMQNYFDNYSVGSGNFTGLMGQDNYFSRQEVQEKDKETSQNRYDFYNNDLVNQTYGKYDWFQNNKSNYSQ